MAPNDCVKRLLLSGKARVRSAALEFFAVIRVVLVSLLHYDFDKASRVIVVQEGDLGAEDGRFTRKASDEVGEEVGEEHENPSTRNMHPATPLLDYLVRL